MDYPTRGIARFVRIGCVSIWAIGGCTQREVPKSPTVPAKVNTAAAVVSAPAAKLYEINVTPPSASAVGKPAVATVQLTPQSGYKVNLEYPAQIVVHEIPGGVAPEQKLSKGEATKFAADGAQWQPAVTASKPGTYTVDATFRFSVCTDTQCELKTEKLSWQVAVN